MKAVILSLVLAALASAQQTSNITLIPTGISPGCTTLLQALNADTTLSSCVQPLISATASFNPLSGANLSSSDIDWSLASMCKANTGCSDGVIRTWLSRFYAACSAELTNPTTYNAQVRELYDILYVVNPLKGAVCSIDSANQQYCVNQVIGVGKNSTGPAGAKASGGGSGSASASAGANGTAAAVAGTAAASASDNATSSASGTAAAASASASVASVNGTLASVSASSLVNSSSASSSSSGSASAAASVAASASASASALPGTAAHFASFATSWSPVEFAAKNLYIAYTSASDLTRRMVDFLPRQDASNGNAGLETQHLATVITPNATTYRTTNLPFLFLQPSFNSDALCTPCTREIMVAYIKWETAVPYALGLAQSPILGGQMDLWTSIDRICGQTYTNAINAQVGQFVGITNSSSAALGKYGRDGASGAGAAVLGAAAFAGVMAYLL